MERVALAALPGTCDRAADCDHDDSQPKNLFSAKPKGFNRVRDEAADSHRGTRSHIAET
jgi:hypothetical protein